ncbi:MAG TPA: carboxypeptidase-like regulatory domain-containing protein [Solirubrobacteraceae bacterium]|nr:carboxypeptidase-like regulatory domain-containing protein [Solirubrobacteraceae bacterium]
MDALIVFHVQDGAGRPIGGALLSSTGGPGPWQDLTNPCGDSMPTLTPADYTISFSAPGYTTRELQVHIDGPGPIIRIGLESAIPPFKQAPRFWQANMCGVRVAGLPAVAGGAADASLVLSWFYDRYSATDRRRIREAWRDRGLTHVLLSWPDSRAAGQSPQDFGATCAELVQQGFYPCPMLCAKDIDPPDVTEIEIRIALVLPWLVGLVPLACVGWELSL